ARADMAILKPKQRRGVYRVRWKESGIPRQQTCRTLEEARNIAAEKTLARRQASPPVTRPNIRLREYADEWLDEITVSEKTKTSYRENLDTYILPVLGSKKVRDIHREHIKRLLGSAKRKRDDSPLSRNTLRLIRATLSVVLGDAVEAGIIAANPV